MVGIRPEAVRLERGGQTARVEHAEYLGADTNLTLSLAGASLVARVPGRVAVAPGAQVAIGYAAEDLHHFGPDGARLQSETVFA